MRKHLKDGGNRTPEGVIQREETREEDKGSGARETTEGEKNRKRKLQRYLLYELTHSSY